ncbi:conserved hypothetical protein [Vibrio chagasii]|nr:conserved hypothetical protein [Vibrio chagasii]CAH7336604.1 conserved hypothetical protein [Vibrio chagasii]
MPYNSSRDWATALGQTLVKMAIATLDMNDQSPESELDEAALQQIALNRLSTILPTSNLKMKEYPIQDALGFSPNQHTRADLAIFNPWDDPVSQNIFTIAEIKRTYERSSNHTDVIQDIARLAILAKKKNVSTYLFLCGRDKNIKKLFTKSVSNFLSQEEEDIKKTTINFDINKIVPELKADYENSLRDAKVTNIITKLIQPLTLDGYSCFVWRVQTQNKEPAKEQISFWIYDGKRD